MTSISVIVPVHDGEKHLPGLLEDLRGQSAGDFEVILVDDASRDGSAAIAERAAAGAWKAVRHERNLGFIESCYRGLAESRGDYVCLLNQDLRLRPSFLEANQRILDADPSIGILGCRVLDAAGRNWFCGGRIRKGIPQILTDDFAGVRDVDWIAGTAACYRRRLLDAIGFFQRRYVMYHEDVELSYRARTRGGARVCAFADPLATHVAPGESSPPRRHMYYHYRNLILFQREHFPAWLPRTLLFYVPGNLARVSLARLPLRAKLDYLKGCARGAADGLLRPSSPPRR